MRKLFMDLIEELLFTQHNLPLRIERQSNV